MRGRGRAATPENNRRVLGYARVSSPDQALGTSLQDQQNAITAYAKTRGLEVTKFFVEAQSAIYEKVEKRDQIRLLLAEVRAGDLILCDKLDRWSRDAEFTYRTVREILEAKASFYAVGDACDPSTKEGDTALGFRILFAREEHKRIKERLVGTRKLMRNAGLWSEGPTPFGYKRQMKKGERGYHKNVLLVVEEEAFIIGKLFSMCIKGASIGDLQKHFRKTHKEYGWDKKMLNGLLRNRVYIGDIQNADWLWIKGKQPPIITVDVFARAQAALDSRRLGGPRHSSTSRTSSWLVREIAKCAACGAKIGASYGETKTPGEYSYYYRCFKRCGAKYIKVELADAAVADLVVPRLAELKKYLAGSPNAPVLHSKQVDYSIHRRRLQLKRDRYLEAFSDDLMDKDRLRERLNALDAESLRVDAREAAQLASAPIATPELRREVLAQVDRVAKAWKGANPQARRAILHELATEVRIGRDVDPVVIWKAAEQIASDNKE